MEFFQQRSRGFVIREIYLQLLPFGTVFIRFGKVKLI